MDFCLLRIVIEYMSYVRVPKSPLPSLDVSVRKDRFLDLLRYAKCFVLVEVETM